jgi:hypothetical protein
LAKRELPTDLLLQGDQLVHPCSKQRRTIVMYSNGSEGIGGNVTTHRSYIKVNKYMTGENK